MILTIDEIREHLRYDYVEESAIDEDTQRENDYLTILYNSAVDYISSYLEFDITTTTELANSVKSALLLVIADLNENREAQTNKQLYNNVMAEKMLQLHRKNLGV
jgi:hypothetical protein